MQTRFIKRFTRFSLRTLLVLPVMLSVSLWWWMRPGAVEAFYPSGQIQSRWVVKRQRHQGNGWTDVDAGPIEYRYTNGTKATEVIWENGRFVLEVAWNKDDSKQYEK